MGLLNMSELDKLPL